MEFNFDEIIAKIPLAEDYKRKHYYTNMKNKACDDPRKYDPFIHVVDYEGREGDMTVYEFGQVVKLAICGESEMIRRVINYVNGTIRKGRTYYKIKNKFKEVYLNGNNSR